MPGAPLGNLEVRGQKSEIKGQRPAGIDSNFDLICFYPRKSAANSFPANKVEQASRVFKYRFNIDGDIDFVPDDNPAAVHCILPANSKVLTIDLSGS